MKNIAYIIMALLFAACTKDMTEIIEVSEIDGSKSRLLVTSSDEPINPYLFARLHEFENGRLLLKTEVKYYYIDMQFNGSVEAYEADNGKNLPATKDYFLKTTNNGEVVLMDKNHQEVNTFIGNNEMIEMAFYGIGQYESNTFYKATYLQDMYSLVNGQNIHQNSNMHEQTYAIFSNENYLFTLNRESQPGNPNVKNFYLNKFTHSLQFIQRTLLGTQNSNSPNYYRFFTNNHSGKVIVSSQAISNGTTVANWTIMDDDFQIVGSFNHAVELNAGWGLGQYHVSKRGEIFSWSQVDIPVYNINSGIQKSYNIREEFGIEGQNNVYILCVGERKAGGFYVLYQFPELGVFNAYLQVLSD